MTIVIFAWFTRLSIYEPKVKQIIIILLNCNTLCNLFIYLAMWHSLENQTNPNRIANKDTAIFDDSEIQSINGEGSWEVK